MLVINRCTPNAHLMHTRSELTVNSEDIDCSNRSVVRIFGRTEDE